MKTLFYRVVSNASLAIALSAGSLLIHVEPAKASNTPPTSPLSLPSSFQWSNQKSILSGDTSVSAQNVVNSLSFAKSYSASYSSAWYYYSEIYFDKNLPAPVGTNITPNGNNGHGSTTQNIQATSGASTSPPLDPIISLNYAEANSSSYNNAWAQDINLFLNRPFHPSSGDPTDVPEPGSLPLLGTGLFGLAIIGFKKKLKVSA